MDVRLLVVLLFLFLFLLLLLLLLLLWWWWWWWAAAASSLLSWWWWSSSSWSWSCPTSAIVMVSSWELKQQTCVLSTRHSLIRSGKRKAVEDGEQCNRRCFLRWTCVLCFCDFTEDEIDAGQGQKWWPPYEEAVSRISAAEFLAHCG